MTEKTDRREWRIVRWNILQGGRSVIEKPTMALPGQDIGGIIKVELARLSKMHRKLDFLANLTSEVVSEEKVREFLGLVLDRYCPDHPEASALRKGFELEDYSFCGVCGQPTEWVLMEKT